VQLHIYTCISCYSVNDCARCNCVYSQQCYCIFVYRLRIHVIVGNSFENKLVKIRCASISHIVDNYVIASIKLFTTKHHYSFVEMNAVHSIYNFILSATADEILDVLLTQRTRVLRQRFSTLRRLPLILNVVNESFMISNKFSTFIGFIASIVVRDLDVIAGESITSFDVCRINLCNSLNAWSTDVFSRFLFILFRIMFFWANDVSTLDRHTARLLSCAC